MSYTPAPVPQDPKDLSRYLQTELPRVAAAVADAADVIFYRTLPAICGSLSAGISANWRVAGNVLLLSSSVTMTLTGLQRDQFARSREVVIFNTGTGVVVLKNAGTESSASNRFALATTWQLSAGAAATLWRDPYVARWRGLNRT